MISNRNTLLEMINTSPISNRATLIEMLKSLLEAIKGDKIYFEEVKNDLMFEGVRPYVVKLLEEHHEETNANVRMQLFSIENDLVKLKEWFDKRYASDEYIKKFDLLKDNVRTIKYKLRTNSYFDLVDALEVIAQSQIEIENIRTSIKNHLLDSKSRLALAENHLNNISIEIEKLYKKIQDKIIVIITLFITIILSIDFSLVSAFIIFIFGFYFFFGYLRKFNLYKSIIYSYIGSYFAFMFILTVNELITLNNFNNLIILFLLMIIPSIPFFNNSELPGKKSEYINQSFVIKSIRDDISLCESSL